MRLLQDEDGDSGEGNSLAAITVDDLIELTTMKKPVMARSVETAVLDAMTQFNNREKWKAWGLEDMREQGAGILLYGPTGTGKTTIAKWMAKQVNRGYKELNLAQIGGGNPGDTERGVHNFFDDARKRKNMTLCLDDCDNLFLDRDSGDLEASWQIGTTEAIMREIARYKGLVIACTNLPDKLDPALESRFLSVVEVGRPDHDCRCRLWKVKIPLKYPLKLTPAQIDTRLAPFDLSGREIENVIYNCSNRCIRKNLKPTLDMMVEFAEKETRKTIRREKAKART